MVAFNICGSTTLYWLYRHLMDLSPAHISQPIRTVHHWHCGEMTGMADRLVHYSHPVHVVTTLQLHLPSGINY